MSAAVPAMRAGVRLAATALPVGVLGQYLLAGLALFHDPGLWAWHGAVGIGLVVPVVVLLARGVGRGAPIGLRVGATVVALLYAVQLALVVVGRQQGWGWAMGLHLFNAGLLLAVAVLLAGRVAGWDK
jgi:hypothetical protein